MCTESCYNINVITHPLDKSTPVIVQNLSGCVYELVSMDMIRGFKRRDNGTDTRMCSRIKITVLILGVSAITCSRIVFPLSSPTIIKCNLTVVNLYSPGGGCHRRCIVVSGDGRDRAATVGVVLVATVVVVGGSSNRGINCVSDTSGQCMLW